MVLILKVTAHQNQRLPKPQVAEFNSKGGSIGRRSDNDLVLLSDSVSRRHAFIRYENGSFYYDDDSTNGTIVRNRNRVLNRSRIQLEDGDVLEIGDFEVYVAISKRAPASLSSGSQFQGGVDTAMFKLLDEERDEIDLFNPKENSESSGPDWGKRSISRSDDDFQGFANATPIENAFVPPEFEQETDEGSLPPDGFSPEDLFSDEPANGSWIPKETKNSRISTGPRPSKNGSTAGENFGPPDSPVTDHDLSSPIKVQKFPPSEKERPPLKPAADRPMSTGKTAEDMFACFLEGAGLEADKILFEKTDRSELMRAMGAIFREMTTGLCTALRGRREQKSELRLAMTAIRPANNNPFKFSPTLEDALKLLIRQNRPGFINGAEAVREGFEDLMNDQVAINAGVQAALLEALEKFDPRHFLESQSKGLGFKKKAQSWNDYERAYHNLCSEVVDTFFGDAFVRAYEEQIERLRTQRGKNRGRENKEG
ncbi:MAG: type VI secretion system-associated FHA domain protein TagH [Desulfosarcina sp.]